MAQQIAVAARAIVPSRMLRLTTTEARAPPTRTYAAGPLAWLTY